VSDDGSLVAFQSNASNLVLGDANGASDVFLAHRPGGAIERVSIGTSGGEANAASLIPTMTPDGVRRVREQRDEPFRATRTACTTSSCGTERSARRRVSVSSSGTQADALSGFYQRAREVVLALASRSLRTEIRGLHEPGDEPGSVGTRAGDVAVRDRQAGTPRWSA
jgi:hypothetical protein